MKTGFIFLKTSKNLFLNTPSPKNLSYFWNFGSMLMFVYIIQILVGFFLSIFFIGYLDICFFNIEFIMRNINMGYFFRLMHLNLASCFFIFIYLHFFRGIFFSSFKYKEVWASGVSILLLLMLIAFTGYVLPWGNMSFWAASVITKFLKVIPFVGNNVLMWVWSGFFVSQNILNFFFSLHFFLPLFMMIFIVLHFVFLHFKGSSSEIFFSLFLMKIKFSTFFLMKDMLNFVFLLSYFLMMKFWFNLTSEGENGWVFNPLVAPLHIKPEWYFLFAYAILRSIPHKLTGILSMALSIMIYYFLLIIYMKYNKNLFFTTMLLFFCFFILSWIGFSEALDIFSLLGLLMGGLYFMLIISIIIFNMFESIFM